MPKIRNLDVIQLMLDHSDGNIDFKSEDDYGNTPLIYASRHRAKDIVQMLLDHSSIANIDLHAEDIHGSTAFYLACQSGNTEIVRLFLEHEDKDVFLSTKNDVGWTAIYIAEILGRKGVVQLLNEYSRPPGLLKSLTSMVSTIFDYL